MEDKQESLIIALPKGRVFEDILPILRDSNFELKDDPKFNFLFTILDLYRQTPDIKPSRVIESLESDQIKGYFSEAVVAGLELSEKNALMLVNDFMDILLKNQEK